MWRFGVMVLPLIFLAGCGENGSNGDSGNGVAAGAAETEGLQAFVGARIFDGTGAPWIEDGVLVVSDGIVQEVGAASQVDVPAGAQVVDLEGRWIVPGFINSHGHAGGDRNEVLRQLDVYAHYGVTTVVSLGGDTEAGVQLRNEQWTPTLDRSRIFVAGPVLNPSTPDEARADATRLREMDVDWLKIRVDDNLGQGQKMPREVYEALIAAGLELGLPLAAHIYQLEDAKGVVEAGARLVAHSVRDAPVDAELAALMRERDVCLVPTLTREYSTFVYAERPSWFYDTFLLERANPNEIAALEDPEYQAQIQQSAAARYWREAFPVAQENMRQLHSEGVGVAMGTDTGPFGRFQGYFEHLEMEMMVDSGMSPVDVLTSATGTAARCMGLEGVVGTLEPGAWADFVALAADPTADIRNTRQIRGVWIAGNQYR